MYAPPCQETNFRATNTSTFSYIRSSCFFFKLNHHAASLIKSMLDAESRCNEGLDDQDTEDLDLVSQLADMSLAKDGDHKEKLPVLDLKNPVFQEQRPSSKITKVVKKFTKLDTA